MLKNMFSSFCTVASENRYSTDLKMTTKFFFFSSELLAHQSRMKYSNSHSQRDEISSTVRFFIELVRPETHIV